MSLPKDASGGSRSFLTCATCHQHAGIFICRGCSTSFCLTHTNEHRDQMIKQMNDLRVLHEKLQEKFQKEIHQTGSQKLLEEIRIWEEQSIGRIRRMAEKLRNEVSKAVPSSTEDWKEQCRRLAEELEQARATDQYFEKELARWKDQLQQMENFLKQQQVFQLYEDQYSIPLVSRMRLKTTSMSTSATANDDRFEENPILKENIQYSSGEHELRFRIQEFRSTSVIRLGIISTVKNDDPQVTFYGWAEGDIVYIAGRSKQGYGDYQTDFQTHDILVLTINCDRDRISLTNERTGKTYHLDVNLHQCPLPWQTSIRLFHDSE